MYDEAKNIINTAQHIVVIQAENPDGDSLGSALALEDILTEQGKVVSLYCPVDMPKYLRYMPGWDRVASGFDQTADAAIIVDTSADVLLSKTLETPGVRHFLESHPVVVIDHHTTKSTLRFEHIALCEESAVATSEVMYHLAEEAGWNVSQIAATHMLSSLLSDTLGLTTPNVSADSYRLAADLTQRGANVAEIEERRREFMKKAPEILEYKGKLIERIEYYLDGQLSIIHIPFAEIEKYSDKYNPSMLVLDEMRLVEGVAVAVAIKTYPDGKLTGKLRSNLPIAEKIAGYFGGGGHDYAAGFRVYENYETILKELLDAADKVLKDSHA